MMLSRVSNCLQERSEKRERVNNEDAGNGLWARRGRGVFVAISRSTRDLDPNRESRFE